ncbi:MAG: TetR/AcrR family transcriptional regulator [Actinomycetota bacterium]|nr:TetR/AcrR family transcriptional regulator [Actinomycetota bacterium]
MPRIKAASIEEHKELVHRLALHAARELFRQKGYQHTSLGEVAAAIGVGRTTLYQYFSDKEDLLVVLVEESLPEAIEEMVGGLPPGLSNREALGELAVRMMEFVATDSNLGTILMREVPRLSQGAQARVREAHARLIDELAAVYEAGVAEGEFRPMPLELAHRFMHELIMSSARVLLGSEEPKQHLHEVADGLVGVLLHGFGAAG